MRALRIVIYFVALRANLAILVLESHIGHSISFTAHGFRDLSDTDTAGIKHITSDDISVFKVLYLQN